MAGSTREHLWTRRVINAKAAVLLRGRWHLRGSSRGAACHPEEAKEPIGIEGGSQRRRGLERRGEERRGEKWRGVERRERKREERRWERRGERREGGREDPGLRWFSTLYWSHTPTSLPSGRGLKIDPKTILKEVWKQSRTQTFDP